MEAAGLIIAIVALLLGVFGIPPFLQMIFGAPQIDIGFAASESEDGQTKILLCHVKNRPVTNPLLLKLGVTRQPIEVDTFFEIYRKGHEDRVLGITEAKLSFGAQPHGQRRTLSGPFPAAFNFGVFFENQCDTACRDWDKFARGLFR
jgi:hypothetical protein